MIHWLIFILGLATVQGLAYSSFGKCSYTGDPHLIPFQTSTGQAIKMYFCQKPGWETLLQNKWVQIIVKVSPSPYVIVDFIVIFNNANQQISCVLIGSSGLSTCASSSSIVSITNSGGTSWNHWYPTAQYLNIQISSFPWGTGKRYDIIIRQTFDLTAQSTGVCVKWNCPLEQIISSPPPIIIKVCDRYITSARQRVIGRVGDDIIKMITTACQNDLVLAFNPKLAQSAVGLVIHSSLNEIDGENYQNAVIKAEENIKAALLEADRLVTSDIGNGGTCLEQKRCLTNDDE